MPQEDCYIVERLRSPVEEAVRTVDDAATTRDVEDYLARCLKTIGEMARHVDSPHHRSYRPRPLEAAANIYEVLTARTFATCSKSESSPLQSATIQRIAGCVASDAPIKLYLDIGGGYSAAVDLRDLGATDPIASLSFAPNCLHVLCLAQIARLAKRIAKIHPPGIRVLLVIDNLVSNYVNDIPLGSTLAFCRRLRQLIDRLGLGSFVDLLVESDVSVFSRDELSSVRADQATALSQREYENVLRFSGRMLDRPEAAFRLRLYREALRRSEHHLARAIDGIHLTQRKEAGTLSFRSFRGGCARIQTGRVCFVRNRKGRMIPKLLTTSNVSRFQIHFVPTTLSQLWAVDPAADDDARVGAVQGVVSPRYLQDGMALGQGETVP
jgi:hypothetical protein